MIKSILTSKYTWLGVFNLCAVICFSIEAGKTTGGHCEWSYKGIDVKGSADCGSFLPDQMCTSAITITRQIEMVWNEVTYNTEVVRRCPWNAYTSVFNFLSIFLAILFVPTFFIHYKAGNYKRIVYLGTATLISFMISSIMMGTDLSSGKSRIIEMQEKYTNYILTYEQSAFVANIVFNVFAFCCMLAIVLSVYKSHRELFRAFTYGYDFKGAKGAAATGEENGAQNRSPTIY